MTKKYRLLFRTSSVTLALLLIAGTFTIAWGQGSGTRTGSKSRDDVAKKKKVAVKAELNAEALKALRAAKVPMVLLDARGKSDQWIPGAKPLAHNADAQTIKRALTRRNQLIVTYCGGPQCPASLMLANHLAEQGYSNVIRYKGGVEAWTQAHYKLSGKPAGSATKKRESQGSKSRSGGSKSRY